MSEDNYAREKWAIKEEALKKDSTLSYLGVYRGLSYVIKNFKNFETGEMSCWCHYIILRLDQIDDKHHGDLWLDPVMFSWGVSHNYYVDPFTRFEFHGGITFYEKTSGLEHVDQKKVIKIGCDYQHSWDEGMCYGINYIECEARKTIDSMWNYFGDIKYRTVGDGRPRYEKELIK